MSARNLSHSLFFLFALCFANTVLAIDLENKLSIRMNPVGLLGATFSGEIPFRINEKFVAGPMFTYQDFSFAGNVNRNNSFGLRLDWHFSEAFRDGAYMSLQTSYVDLYNSITEKDKVYSMDDSGISVVGVVGYLWRWDNVTFNLGIGLGYDTLNNTDLVAEDGEVYEPPIKFPEIPVTLGGDFTLGWAF